MFSRCAGEVERLRQSYAARKTTRGPAIVRCDLMAGEASRHCRLPASLSLFLRETAAVRGSAMRHSKLTIQHHGVMIRSSDSVVSCDDGPEAHPPPWAPACANNRCVCSLGDFVVPLISSGISNHLLAPKQLVRHRWSAATAANHRTRIRPPHERGSHRITEAQDSDGRDRQSAVQGEVQAALLWNSQSAHNFPCMS